MKVKPALTPADRALRRGRSVRAGLVVAGAVALFLALTLPLSAALIDDTFIHLQYARNFRDGHGLVFNVGERVFGTTSPAWSMGLGLLGRLGIDLYAAAKVGSLLFGVLALGAFALALRRFLATIVGPHGYASRRTEVAWACGVVAFAADAWLVRWSSTGMETSCGVFLVIAGFASFFATRPWGTRIVTPTLWWSLAALVRPEATLLVLLLVARIILANAPWPRRLKRAAGVLVLAGLVQAPWLTYAWSFYGTLVPQTLAAKTAGGVGPAMFLASLARQAQEILATRAVEAFALLALLPALASALWRRRAEHFLPLGWLVLLPLLYAVRGVHPISRYLLPLAPVLLFHGWGALAALAAAERRAPARAVTLLATACLLALALNGFLWARFVVPHARTFSADARAVLGGYGEWVRDNTPPGTTVAIPDIGLFAWTAERPVLDLAGLVSPGITRLIGLYGNSEEGTLVTRFQFAGVARPEYLIDRASRPRRLLEESPYAPCLTVIDVVGEDGAVRYRGLRMPGAAYYTLYRIDWAAFDRMAGAERQASAASRSVRSAMAKSFGPGPPRS